MNPLSEKKEKIKFLSKTPEMLGGINI